MYEAEFTAEEAGSYFVNVQAMEPERDARTGSRPGEGRHGADEDVRRRAGRGDGAVLARVRRPGEQHAAAAAAHGR